MIDEDVKACLEVRMNAHLTKRLSGERSPRKSMKTPRKRIKPPPLDSFLFNVA